MPQFRPKTSRNSRARYNEFVFSSDEVKLLKKIGLHIQNRLHLQEKALEDFAYEIKISRSALTEIVAGRSNMKFLTLVTISKGLGYDNIIQFLKAAE